MNEIWKDVVGYEGLYQVSNLGKVRSCDFYRNGINGFKKLYKGKILNGVIQKSGYIAYDLHKNNKRKNIRGHVIVAKSFFGDESKSKVVNHKNGIKTDNRIENLEWVTFRENVKHAFKNRLIVHKGFCILHLQTGVFFESIGQVYRSFNFNYSLSYFKKTVRKNPDFLIV
jgi:hypothetical protein